MHHITTRADNSDTGSPRKNQQEYALSRLLTNCETIRKDDDDDVFTLDLIFLDNHYKYSEHSDEVQDIDFLDAQHADIDREITRNTAPEETPFELIDLEELLVAQLQDSFCSDSCRRLNSG